MVPYQENTIGFRNLKVYYFQVMLHIYANDAMKQTELKGEGVIIAWILDRQKCFDLFVSRDLSKSLGRRVGSQENLALKLEDLKLKGKI